ncbi:mechanosensitive ion channel family protein [Acidisoma cladoniae]|uniref:mechanosensitive ion channel family protein n=1 Tax=Acidisoma cladoniae TaxID=3040935 RepID=UPI00254A1434|nr:mechanosensitive ion channel family protein [Acidisoma sp. PAMC 29798]
MAGAIVGVGFLVTRFTLRHRPVGQFLCQLATVIGFTAVLVSAGVIPIRPTPVMDLTLTYLIISFFKIVWWLGAAWLVAGFVHAALIFQRKPVETQFLQDVCSGFIYVSAVFGIIAYVFDTPISGLLAASGVLAIVLGLALQSTLGDVFSGVVLNLAKPYRSGDWITIDGGLAGRIIETNWRATQILTQSNDLAVVPNSILAKAKIVNASKPAGAHGVTISVRLDPVMAPSNAVAVLETAMLNCTQILRVPAPAVAIQSLDAIAMQCELQFFVSAIESGANAQNEVFDRIFRHCASAGIRLAPPTGSALALPPQDRSPDIDDVPRRMLDRLSVFASLSDDERLALAPKMTRKVYKSGDVLIEQGAISPALFILYSGVLVVLKKHEDKESEVFRLAPGECFGQASVLTGAPNSFRVTALIKSVAYEILREDLGPVLQHRPAIAAELGRIIAKREANGASLLHAGDDARKPVAGLAKRLAGRIKTLFGLESPME